MIEVSRLSKTYGRHRVLQDLCLEVAGGEVVLLVGANGCGKSTTLRLIAGLSRADAGQMRLDGHDVAADAAAARGTLSYLPQSPRFHARLTVSQILSFYGRLRGLPPARVETVVERWGLADYRTVVTGRLSGGTRQRLGLAVLDLPDASILMLDEPGLSLDPEWRRRLQQYLRAQAAAGKTVLVATHLLGEWEGEADRCLVLEGGQVDREVGAGQLRQAFPFALRPAAAVAQ
jgi:ABC-2 type transport system ATP-binding protein